MKALILAAGLGTRLRPWTLEHPKALVPVAGQPMLGRVIAKLRSEGFDNLAVNVHHFARQITDFLASSEEYSGIRVSDESDELKDTGGALVAAREIMCADAEPFLVHNVDILSNADLRALMQRHKKSGADVSLLVSPRSSSRRLHFHPDGTLAGWSGPDGARRPEGFEPSEGDAGQAFSGIYVVSPQAVDNMVRLYGTRPFPVMDYLLSRPEGVRIAGVMADDLQLIDIGKPDTLALASEMLG